MSINIEFDDIPYAGYMQELLTSWYKDAWQAGYDAAKAEIYPKNAKTEKPVNTGQKVGLSQAGVSTKTLTEQEQWAVNLETWTDSFGNKLIGVHAEGDCHNEHCVIHNWSNHHMTSFPMFWNSDARRMERVCKHAVGHPDPDEINQNRSHGCDGCCKPQQP